MSQEGTYRKACRSKKQGDFKNRSGATGAKNTKYQKQATLQVEEEEVCSLYVLGSQDAIKVNMTVAGRELELIIDTGATITVIPRETYEKQLSHVKVQSSNVKLQSYYGQTLSVRGEVAAIRGKVVVVNAANKTAVLARNWLSQLKLDWASLFSLNVLDPVHEFPELFKEGMGKLQGVQAKITLSANARPAFHKARPVPFALQAKVDTEIDRLVREGVLTPVEQSEWASPIVVVRKSDGSIRLCGDYKVTINEYLGNIEYPTPNAQDLFATLAGGRRFTRLDLKQAYQQMEVDTESQQYLTINTRKGLFTYTRMPFGIRTARVRQVLQRLKQRGVRPKKDKYHEGLKPTEGKVKAIREAPEPRNVTELKAVLGLLNYYSHFLPNLSNTLQALYELLQKGKQWRWTRKHRTAFNAAKNKLLQSGFLTHYDLSRPVKLKCDASPYGIGACLSHEFEDGSERPVAFASRTLSSAEKGYPQIERYPGVSSSKAAEVGTNLSAYKYNPEFKAGEENKEADMLSRLPMEVNIIDPNQELYHVDCCKNLPVTAAEVARQTKADPILRRAFQYTLSGWNWKSHMDPRVQPYSRRSDELSVEENCLLWGTRVIIPQKLQSRVLADLQENLLGSNRMKALARSYIWWPSLDMTLEELCKKYEICQSQRNKPAAGIPHPWMYPTAPWERVHADFVELKTYTSNGQLAVALRLRKESWKQFVLCDINEPLTVTIQNESQICWLTESRSIGMYDTQVGGFSTTGNQMAIEGSANAYCNAAHDVAASCCK
ncbi:uncharacterized protein K02A2.6-like [Corticium candelabrum]|uniref:uncharacterized protein K02A2.6-like n=1 Tax=Corticium candelabrum TaxID=121492 RepID=UPI002E26B919|nr:uncharacterized protein K02A2.6-like [Corticium candelabrum]